MCVCVGVCAKTAPLQKENHAMNNTQLFPLDDTIDSAVLCQFVIICFELVSTGTSSKHFDTDGEKNQCHERAVAKGQKNAELNIGLCGRSNISGKRLTDEHHNFSNSSVLLLSSMLTSSN